MPDESYQLITVCRALEGGVELAEALGFPEVSAVDDSERKWRATLGKKAKMVLEDHELSPEQGLFRRRLAGPVEVAAFEILFDPVKRQVSWQEPVRLRVEYVRWVEGELHHGFAPAFRVHVFGTAVEQLEPRLMAHIRLVLPEHRKQVSLRRLAAASVSGELRVGALEVSAKRKSPKQIAASENEKGPEESTLPKVATLLDGPLAPAFEVETEVARLAEALSGERARSVLIVGAPGSGKSAVVRELARRRREFAFGQTPFWSTTGARLMMGQLGFGMWQERCAKMCREAAKAKAVLHLNHLSELLEVGKASRGEQSVGGFLRPWLARGEVLAIAECTPEELGAIERTEPHLAACFQRLNLEERNSGQTREILRRVYETLDGMPPVDLTGVNAGLDRLQRLHERYATYSANPGRPLRFLKNLLGDRFPVKDFSESDVIAAFSRETGLPLLLLDDELALNWETARGWFGQRVVGQTEAVDCALDLLAMTKARLARPRKPLASFLFIGPTGTGKTEMAKAFAEFLFGDAARLSRFDLNQFNDAVSVQRLIGGPAVGSAEGLLTARVREQPFSVLLLDEFEKADPSFFDLLLQILGDGRLTDAAGRVADFCNCVIVMTSNLGAQGFQRGSVGFRTGTVEAEAKEHFAEAVRKFLRPEIYNRLDAIVPFRPLTEEIVLAIARRHLELLQGRDGIRLRDLELKIDAGVAEHLAKAGYDPKYGARPLKRAIERELLAPLADALAPYRRTTPLVASMRVAKRKLAIMATAKPTKADDATRKRSDERAAREVIEMRRRVGKLGRSHAAQKVDDEVTILEAMERRVAEGKWKQPAALERVAALPKFRAWQQAMGSLSKRARNLESDVLGLLYGNSSPEGSLVEAELSVLRNDFRDVSRGLLRLQQPQPDEVVLAFYSEDRETLFDFVRAYAAFGELRALDYFEQPPGARSNATKLLRVTPKKAEEFLAEPQERAVGVVMHLQGELFATQFGSEAGLHARAMGKEEKICLIDLGVEGFVKYQALAGIERSGAIKARAAPLVRTFVPAKREVEDERFGTVPWIDEELHRCIAALTEKWLQQRIDGLSN